MIGLIYASQANGPSAGLFFQHLPNRIDGRDLWSGRVSIGWKPVENLQTTLVWEHFSEDDDRMRTAKQLCKTARARVVAGISVEGITRASYNPAHII